MSQKNGHEKILNSAIKLRSVGKFKEAYEEAQKYIELVPNAVDGLQITGILASEIGCPEVGIEHLIKAIEISPGGADLYANIGVLYRSIGDFDNALKAQQDCLKLDPDKATAYNSIGNLHSDREEFDEADKAYTKAISIDSQYTDAWINRARLRLKTQNFLKALKDSQQAARLSPTNATAWHFFATASIGLVRIEQALAAIQRARELSPSNPRIITDTARILWMLRDAKPSISMFQKALELDPISRDAQRGLGASYLLDGQLQKGWNELSLQQELSNASMIGIAQWMGQPLKNKSLLVLISKFSPDEIFALRHLAQIVDLCSSVTVCCEKQELRYLLSTDGNDVSWVVSCDDVKAKDFDYYVDISEVPYRLGVDFAKREPVGYLSVAKQSSEKWYGKIKKGKKKAVAFLSTSDFDDEFNALRSVPSDLAALLHKIDGFIVYDLNGEKSKNNPYVLHNFKSISDLMGFLSQMEMVVGCDALCSHLAAAMGLDVKIILRRANDWRWASGDQETSIWYPSAQVFDYPRGGKWQDTLTHLGEALTGKKADHFTLQDYEINKKHPPQTNTVIEQAQKLYTSGQLDRAITLLEKNYKNDLKNFDALSLLGGFWLSKGDPTKSVSYLTRALKVRPKEQNTLTNLGAACRMLGKFDKAIDLYRTAIRVAPNEATPHNNLGNVFLQIGRHDEAEKSFNHAISLRPDYPEPYRNLAEIYRQRKDYDKAMKFCDAALSYRAGYIDADLLKVSIFRDQEKFNSAIQHLRPILGKAPKLSDAHMMMGSCLYEIGKFYRAEVYLLGAIRLDPNNIQAVRYLSRCFLENGKRNEALSLLKGFVGQHPNVAMSYRMYAYVLKNTGNLKDAIIEMEKAVKLTPKDGGLRMEYAFMLIADNQLDLGYQEYEWRRQSVERFKRNFTKPHWDGSTDLNGKRVLVYSEQGMGANIHYARYVSLLEQMGATVLLAPHEPLRRLFQKLCAKVDIVALDISEDQYDFVISMLSMPSMFKTNESNIPLNIPYFKPDQIEQEKWRQRLVKDGDTRPLVGLAWQGNPQFGADSTRSMPVIQFEPMIRELQDRVRFISLQVAFGREQLQHVSSDIQIEDQVDYIDDYEDTAALLPNLNLIISTDTSVPHLSGALDIPTWVILEKYPDWRYQLDREDMPWYPRMKLFRQREDGKWSDPIAQMTNALKEMFDI